MKVNGPGINAVFLRETSNTRAQMAEVQTQIASGKVSSTYGGLGADRSAALSLRQQMAGIGALRSNIETALPRVKVMTAAVEGMRSLATNTRSAMLVGGFDVTGNSRTQAQEQAQSSLSAAIDLLNTEIGGRHLFSGTQVDTAPVISGGAILDGAGGKAGFRQIMSERRQADLGADGLGRLDLTALGGGVNLSEDAAGSPFGFKLAAVASNLSGATVTGPAGAPAAVDVAFGAPLPKAGDSLTFALDMPDGTSAELRLEAITTGTPGEGQFLVGADADATAASFGAALSAALVKTASQQLAAASMQAAADDFFTSGSGVAQRVDGPPFDSATSLRNATDADTVAWYGGEKSDQPARETAIARADENQLVAYGARADEAAFTNLVKQLAVLSAATFDPADAVGYEKYAAMTDRVSGNLAYSVKADSLERVTGELALAEAALGQADERHQATDNMLTDYLGDIETTDINQAGAKLLSLQTQLQASYQVTSMLSKLSLVNFL